MDAGGDFIVRELIITEGSMFSFKNANTNCVSNCELYMSNGFCILCSAGYATTSSGNCILKTSCLSLDTNIN